MEKLIEEIQAIHKAGKENRLPRISPQQLIILIGKAIISGESKELDRMLGVVGRGKMEKRQEGSWRIERELWVGEITAQYHQKEPPDFIALSGTGKEEE